jgi:hypothetical protein
MHLAGLRRARVAVMQTANLGDGRHSSPVHTENAIAADLLILVRPQCWRIVSAERSALLPSGIINTIVTRSIGLALNGPFCVDPAGR